MTPLDRFNGCTKGLFNESKGKLSWKVEEDEIFFQPSKGLEDWMKNMLVFPVPIFWGGVFIFIPLGVALDLPVLAKVLKGCAGISHANGYSRGGWEAVLTALKLCIPCTTFGCPGVFWRPSRKVQAFLDANVTHYENPTDIVCTVPIGYSHSVNRIKLGGGVFSPPVDSMDELLSLNSGHSPAEYRFRLQGVD